MVGGGRGHMNEKHELHMLFTEGDAASFSGEGKGVLSAGRRRRNASPTQHGGNGRPSLEARGKAEHVCSGLVHGHALHPRDCHLWVR